MAAGASLKQMLLPRPVRTEEAVMAISVRVILVLSLLIAGADVRGSDYLRDVKPVLASGVTPVTDRSGRRPG